MNMHGGKMNGPALIQFGSKYLHPGCKYRCIVSKFDETNKNTASCLSIIIYLAIIQNYNNLSRYKRLQDFLYTNSMETIAIDQFLLARKITMSPFLFLT